MDLIDAHTHLADGRFADRVLADGDALGVGTFVCSNLGGWEHYPSIEAIRSYNRTMADVTRRHEGRILGYCYVNPRHGTAACDDLRRLIEEAGFVGVKLWVAALCDDRLVDPVVELAIGYRVPVLVHAWRKTVGQLPDESTADNVARLAARYPESSLIMAHLGGQVESALNAVRPFPNVLVDTSGTIIAAGEVAVAVRRLGADRVVFGSDVPIACLATGVGKVYGADLAPDAARLVLGGTMRRLLDKAVR